MSSPALIRTMKGSDLRAAGGWAEAEGWTSESIEEFEAFLAYDPGGCFILEHDGVPVAVCVAGDIDIQAGVLDVNGRAIDLFRSLGFAEKPYPSRRMVLGEGEPVGLHPSLLSIGTAAKG